MMATCVPARIRPARRRAGEVHCQTRRREVTSHPSESTTATVTPRPMQSRQGPGRRGPDPTTMMASRHRHLAVHLGVARDGKNDGGINREA
jgi:hypothetical protein